MKARLLSLVSLVAAFSIAANQYSDLCLQDPNRTQQCPHTLIKVAKLDVPAIEVNKGDMICLCLTDLTDIASKEQQQNMLDKIADANDLSVAEIYQLLELHKN
jgi:hypothetical protein